MLMVGFIGWPEYQKTGGLGEMYWSASLHFILRRLGFQVDFIETYRVLGLQNLSMYHRIVLEQPRWMSLFEDPTVICSALDAPPIPPPPPVVPLPPFRVGRKDKHSSDPQS